MEFPGESTTRHPRWAGSGDSSCLTLVKPGSGGTRPPGPTMQLAGRRVQILSQGHREARETDRCTARRAAESSPSALRPSQYITVAGRRESEERVPHTSRACSNFPGRTGAGSADLVWPGRRRPWPAVARCWLPGPAP